MDLITLVLTTFVCLLATAYFYLRRQQQQWPRLGVPAAANPHLLFGNVRGIYQEEHSCTVLQRLYWELKGRGLKLGGIMNSIVPAILVVDPEISQSILVKDFHKFHDRGVFVDPVGDPLSASLFTMEGAAWIEMRRKLSPTFTGSKMKYMFGAMLIVAERMKAFLAENCHRENLELKIMLQSFTIDVIGNVAFGIECDSFGNPNSEFRLMGLKANRFDWKRFIKFFIGGSYKRFSKMMRLKVVDDDVNKFFTDLARNTVHYREENGVKRNDFLNLLMEIKNEGEGITMDEIAAQCFVFFAAGLETSSTTMNFCLYELAVNSDVQERLRQEIEESIAEAGGQLTYDSLNSMDYLDRVVSETLRKYAPVDNLFRISNSPFTPEGLQFTIPPGTLFHIPVHSMHMDPEYFPDPERFDPDRFLPDVKKSRHPYVYLPFGKGPRICIGERFGLMMTKIGLITLVRNFRFSPRENTPDQLQFEPKVFVSTAKTGMYLRIGPIQL